jgi:hypothetical protein
VTSLSGPKVTSLSGVYRTHSQNGQLWNGCWWRAPCKGGAFPVGASPTRQPHQPEAIGAVMEVTKWLKPSISVSRIGDSASVAASGLSSTTRSPAPLSPVSRRSSKSWSQASDGRTHDVGSAELGTSTPNRHGANRDRNQKRCQGPFGWQENRRRRGFLSSRRSQ